METLLHSMISLMAVTLYVRHSRLLTELAGLQLTPIHIDVNGQCEQCEQGCDTVCTLPFFCTLVVVHCSL